MTSVDQIRDMSTEDILDAIEDLKVELYTYRVQKVTGEIANTSLFRKSRREIARLMTVLHERNLAAQQVEKE